MSEFTSEGFDLDAVGNNNDSGEDVIFEIGGGATVVPAVEEPHQLSPSSPSPSDANTSTPIDKAEEWKQLGNEEFKKKNYLEAYDMYTEAIDACPCPVNVEEIFMLIIHLHRRMMCQCQ